MKITPMVHSQHFLSPDEHEGVGYPPGERELGEFMRLCGYGQFSSLYMAGGCRDVRSYKDKESGTW